MVELIVTPFAVERYVERIGGNEDHAVAVLSSPAVHAAARFGARVLRINGARVLMKFEDGFAVVMTVVPFAANRQPHQLVPHAWGGPPPSREQLPHLRKEPIHA